jgi:uncharacterized membrane protein
MSHHNTREGSGEQLALGLGLFSIGLGLAEILAPRGVARLVGLPAGTNPATLQGFGMREIGNGLAILAQPDRPAWLWSRVGGDALDLAYLASGMNHETADQRRLGAAIAAVLGVTALDAACAVQLNRAHAAGAGEHEGRRRHTVRVERVTTIKRPIEEVYQYWKRFENLPKFMRHLERVETLGNGRSRWRAKAPLGRTVEWEAEILQDRENEWIAWRSIPGSDVENSGSVRFSRAPGARGTEIRVQLQYTPPAGAFGRLVAQLFGEEPEQQIHEDLHRFKQLMETGEIPISDGPSLWRAAQPAKDVAKLRALTGVQS